QDRGFTIIGTSNRTELETGFYLPLGDGLWHCGPIVHLYKCQVRQLADRLGTRKPVLDQPASAGFWEHQEDLEDLAYLLYHGGPISRQIHFDDSAEKVVRSIYTQLTIDRVDATLFGLHQGRADIQIADVSELPEAIVARFRCLRDRALATKRRP